MHHVALVVAAAGGTVAVYKSCLEPSKEGSRQGAFELSGNRFHNNLDFSHGSGPSAGAVDDVLM
jgi:hypothetical protein